MKRTALLFFAFSLLSIGLFASGSTLDSLKQKLIGASGHQRVDILNALGWELKYTDTKAAFGYSNEASELAEQLQYPKGIVKASQNLAALNILTNKKKEALDYANEGILYATAICDTFTLAKLYNIKALVLEDQYAYSLAIDYFKKSYNLFEQIGDKTEAAGLLNNLAVLYGAINEKKLELETLIKVIDLEEKTGNKLGLARSYNNIAGVYIHLDDPLKALDYYKKGLKFSKEVSSARYESASLNGLGLVMQSLKKYDSAIVYYLDAAAMNKKNGYVEWMANNYVNLGGLFLHDLDDFPHANKYLNEAASIYLSINDWDDYIVTNIMLLNWYLDHSNYTTANQIMATTDLYADSITGNKVKRDYYYLKYRSNKLKGNNTVALDYLEKVIVLNDSLRAQEERAKSLEIQIKYDLTRQQQENERLRLSSSFKSETIKKQKIIIAGSVIISLLLAATIFISFRSKSRIKRVNKALFNVSQQIREKAVELQQANDSKDKFLSIISHDLKNPISAITGLSELLIDESMDMTEEDRQMYVKYIHEGCKSADHLLENLMKWVRSQTGKMEMKPTEFDLARSVEDAITLVTNAAFRKNIAVNSQVKEGTMVYADPEMMNTCLINLLSNAVKFTPVNGQVTVTHESNGQMMKVHVQDTGVGISPESMQKLFRLDTKSGTMGTANEKGTGLGLLLVKEFIEKNHGTITVESLQGTGSTFTLAIPKEPLT